MKSADTDNTPRTITAPCVLHFDAIGPKSDKAQSALVIELVNGALADCGFNCEPQILSAIEQCEPREKAFADMLAALERVAEMTCEDTGRNFDEWGEAACFTDCQKIARETLASVKGRAS